MIIYVITEGRYSDYHIITATDNKEMAYNLADIIKDSRVEEFDSEHYSIIGNRKVYQVEEDKELISWDNIGGFKYKSLGLKAKEMTDAYAYEEANNTPNFFNGCFQTSYIWAEDEGHALKICYDAIAEEKAIEVGIY